MPKVRRSRKNPPEGYELIDPTIEELDQKMKEGISAFFYLEKFPTLTCCCC